MYFTTFEITFSQKDEANFSKRREQAVNLQLNENLGLTKNILHMASNKILTFLTLH